MADIALFVTQDTSRPSTHYQNGDIVVAINDHRRSAALARASWQNVAVRNADGYWTPGGAHEAILNTFCRMKFTRVSRDEVRVEKAGWTTYIVGPTPTLNPNTGREEMMRVVEYVARRRASGKKLFGTEGNEFWFGEEQSAPPIADLNVLWTTLNGQGITLPDRWPFSVREKQFMLALKLPDFAGARQAALVEPVFTDPPIDENGVALEKRVQTHKRRMFVDWEAITGINATRTAQIYDDAQELDFRDLLDGRISDASAIAKV